MIRPLDHPEPVIIEQAFGRFVHREFPVLIARVKKIKNRDAGEIVRVARKAA
jgi:hypothetical protein